MASPPKRDAWTPYRSTRLVLIRCEGATLRPWQGFVVDWKLHEQRWFAQVVYFHDEGVEPGVRVQWFPRTRLVPVWPDPNEVTGARPPTAPGRRT